tara:strand:+ start:2888 stop:3733 length:846 start_codon:yes stop_codon:yes gene_type:complete
MSIEDITVIITSFKSNDKIINCLKSINNQCKVIVVENSNDTKIKQMIESQFNNVNCILSGANLGYGRANNLGLKNVKTKYALILNPDATLEKSTLENFLILVKQNLDFAIIGPMEQEKSESISLIDKKNDSLIKVENVKGFAMFLNLEQFEEVGFFDENFFIYFEEIDLCKRLSKLNKKIYLSSEIKINHLGAQSHDDSINKKMELSRNWHWMWSTFYYHRKYKGFIVAFIITFPKLFSAVIKMIIYSLLMKKYKSELYYQRFSGLLNAIMGKKSWYRPKV